MCRNLKWTLYIFSLCFSEYLVKDSLWLNDIGVMSDSAKKFFLFAICYWLIFVNLAFVLLFLLFSLIFLYCVHNLLWTIFMFMLKLLIKIYAGNIFIQNWKLVFVSLLKENDIFSIGGKNEYTTLCWVHVLQGNFLNDKIKKK